MKIHLASISLKHEPCGTLVEREREAQGRERADGIVHGLRCEAEVHVAMWPSLAAQQGIDAPSASDARSDTGGVKGVDDGDNP